MKTICALAIAAIGYISGCSGNNKNDYCVQLPSNCFISRSGATVMCKKYAPDGSLGAITEFHPDFNDGPICFYTRGNLNLCSPEQMSGLEKNLISQTIGNREYFSAEIVDLAVNF